jgi:hypothetical protein
MLTNATENVHRFKLQNPNPKFPLTSIAAAEQGCNTGASRKSRCHIRVCKTISKLSFLVTIFPCHLFRPFRIGLSFGLSEIMLPKNTKSTINQKRAEQELKYSSCLQHILL